ncbi:MULTISPECIES: DUF7668 domain-containing protein [Stenotrophomonas]|uniref:DUF7668 domain-containing protein n=1 Tax=Stenotrophomonas maltophilia TaxID=40324 RepID=A0A431UGC2_STEMA|nr:hypothetical protein [Stenotrophomonas maltophilia]RTQ88643.1 hypothetical protein EKL94_12340 [Stenotrophomonas maltophilia]
MARKDPDTETPVDEAFRPTLAWMANEIAAGRAPHAANVPACSADIWDVITGIIADYGETLVTLPEASWETSVSQWHGERWKVLVDLYTAVEGRSDLVMDVDIAETETGFEYSLHLVYVP